MTVRGAKVSRSKSTEEWKFQSPVGTFAYLAQEQKFREAMFVCVQCYWQIAVKVVPGNESSMEQLFQGMKVSGSYWSCWFYWSFCSWELIDPGVKMLWICLMSSIMCTCLNHLGHISLLPPVLDCFRHLKLLKSPMFLGGGTTSQMRTNCCEIWHS